MRPHCTRLICGLSVLAALNLAAHAAESGDARFSARVKLTISASDGVRDSVQGCLTEELRALNDVRLVGDKPDWEISVLALDVRSTRGYRGGIAISTIVLPRFHNEKIALFFRPTEQRSGLAQTSNLWEYPAHSLHMDASDRLQVMCKQIAADFDARQLEKSRGRFRDAQELPQGNRLPRIDETVK